MIVIGRRFIATSEKRNQAEAEYRYVLTRLRENAESIALLQGEVDERSEVDKSLQRVLSAWRVLCMQFMRTTIVSQTNGYAAVSYPSFYARPSLPRRLDDARRSHARGLGIHNSASCIQLASR